MDTGRVDADISDPGAVVRLPAFQDVLLCLVGLAHGVGSQAVPGQGNVTPKQAQKVLRTRLKKLHALVLQDAKKFLLLDEALQHRVRKRLKRLRYLAEFSAPLYSTRKTKAYTSALKPTQDALGRYNDESVALQTYRSLAEQDPRAWFGVGWLSARQPANATLCQTELLAFANARAFWK